MRKVLLIVLIGVSFSGSSQPGLKPGFDAKEYMALFSGIRRGIIRGDSTQRERSGDTLSRIYTSPEVGLKNRWNLFLRNDGTAVISIRGTVGDAKSWLANFYAAMIPASGVLHLNDSTRFNYTLAEDKRAAVHAGWALSMAYLAPDIVKKIKEYAGKGVKNYYIIGHSQGAAIAFMLRSYLFYLQKNGGIPQDIKFKTYCSAAPKPGNQYYAYDFEFINRGGWAYTVVNAADWVPETPYTVQHVRDMNDVNPLIHTRAMLKRQKWFVKTVGGYFYGKIERRPRKLQKMYTRMFGNTVYRYGVKKALPQFSKPAYVASENFVRAGTLIVLMPDDEYFRIFHFDEKKKDYFIHHHFEPYYYLVKKYYLQP